MLEMYDVSALNIIVVLLIVFALLLIWRGVKVVPQSDVYVVERFGKYQRTLPAGLNLIVPFLDTVSHRISVLERQLPEFAISVITRDNVEVNLRATVFYRISDAAHSVYRIRDVDGALHTEATSIVRSAAGRLELDELQSSRESMNQEIGRNLQAKAEEWGLNITSTAITDVVVDEVTKAAQRQQLNAERERRAAIARAEGDKRAVELAAEARLFEAQKGGGSASPDRGCGSVCGPGQGGGGRRADTTGRQGDRRQWPAGGRFRSPEAPGRRHRPARGVAELQDDRRSDGCDRGHRSAARDCREHGEAGP